MSGKSGGMILLGKGCGYPEHSGLGFSSNGWHVEYRPLSAGRKRIDMDGSKNMFTMRSGAAFQANIWQFLSALEIRGGEASPLDQKSGAASLLGQVMLSMFIGYWLWQAGVRPNHTPAPRQVRRAVEWIHANIDRDIYLEELSRVAGVSIRCLQTGFKRQFGMGPIAYISGIRLKHAHEDLKSADPDVTVAEIAKRWRFSRSGEFSARYKTMFGRYPSETRREYRREARGQEINQPKVGRAEC